MIRNTLHRLRGKRLYLGEAAWVLAGQAMAGVAAILGVRLLSRNMAPDAYGQFNLALTGTMLIHLFSSGPINQAATRYFSSAEETGGIRNYLRALLRITGWIYGVVILLTAAGLVAMSAWSGLRQWRLTAVFWLVYSLFYAGTTIMDAVQAGARRRAVSALHQALAQWLRPLAALCFFAFWSHSCDSAMAGFAAASFLVFISEVFFLLQTSSRAGAPCQAGASGALRVVPVETVAGYERKILAYAWPFASYGILAWLQLASDRWLLDLFHGPASVAALSVGYQLGYQPMNLITTAISAFVTPILFSTAGDGEDAVRMRRAEKINDLHILGLAGFTVLATLLAFLLRKPVFALLTSDSYASFSMIFPLMVAAGGIFSLGQAFTMYFFLGSKSSAIVGPKVISSIVGIIMNFVGAKYFGVQGAVVSTLLFSILYAFIIARSAISFRRSPISSMR